MDEIRTKINNLIDKAEKDRNNIEKELFLYKIAVIISILRANTFIALSHSKRQLNRIKRIKSKNNSYESKFNNLRKLVLKSFE